MLRLAVDLVVWRDAQMKMREMLDTGGLIRNTTIGFVVHEDAEKVILAHEMGRVSNPLNEDMDYTTIPKVLIDSRRTVASVRFKSDGSPTEPRRRSVNADSSPQS